MPRLLDAFKYLICSIRVEFSHFIGNSRRLFYRHGYGGIARVVANDRRSPVTIEIRTEFEGFAIEPAKVFNDIDVSEHRMRSFPVE
ncbi:MAG: hypothetical protein OXF79_15935 [Chloroflexi bacterium]|nr:hypothetical protein [Chloroflexota bacterium]